MFEFASEHYLQIVLREFVIEDLWILTTSVPSSKSFRQIDSKFAHDKPLGADPLLP